MMPEADGRVEIRVGYAPDLNAYSLVLPDMRMRIDIPLAGWEEFLNWLRTEWPNRPFRSFEVVYSPRLDANLLLFTVQPEARMVCCLWALPPEAWPQLVADLTQRGEELRRDHIEPFHQFIQQGLSKEAAIERMNRGNPFDMETLWRAPN